MPRVRSFARWAGALACWWLSAVTEAQACIPAVALSKFDNWPSCKFTPPSDASAKAPTLLSAGTADAYCRVETGKIVTGDKVEVVAVGVGDPPTGACAVVHKTDAGTPYIAVRLPEAGVSPVWMVKTDNAFVSVQAVAANLPGFMLPATQPLPHVYSLGVDEIPVSLRKSLTVAYGTPRVVSVSPEVQGTTFTGLDIVLPASSQPRFSNLQITIDNEYGQQAQLALLLVPEAGYSDSPTLQSLKIELAHIRKLAADEKFMRARAGEDGLLDAKEATALSALYKAARESLPACAGERACGELSRAQLATAGLLRADIDYRSLLLEKRMTFWGGFRTLRPTTPHHELIKLSELMKKFTEANNKMESWQFRSSNKKERAQEISAEKAYVQGQVKAEELGAEVKAIDTNRWQRLKASNAMAKKAMEQEISNVADRMDKLEQQQEALAKQATSQAMNLAASVAGVPVDTVAGLAEGDLKKAAVGYVSAELSNPSSTLSAELQHFGDALVDANGALANLRETYKDVKDLQNNVDLVAVAIREPSMERFLKVGELAYAKMDDNQRRQIDQLIESQKPVQAWLQSSYQQVAAARGEIEGYRSTLRLVTKEMTKLPPTVNAEARSILKQELKKARGEGEQAARAGAARMLDGLKELQLTGGSAEKALVSALAAYPDFVAETNPNLWYSMKARYPALADQELVVQFLSAANASLSMSRRERSARVAQTGFGFVAEGQLAIENSGQLRYFDVGSDILKQAIRVDPARLHVDAQNQLESLIEAVLDNASSDKLMSYVATAASAEGATAFITRFVANDQVPRMWKNLKGAPAQLKTEVEPGIRHAMAASLASPALPRPTVPPLPADTAIPAAGAQEQMQNQMVAMALNTAFPGAGTALQLGQTFAAMDANRELNAMLTQQSAKLISAYQELLRSSEDADFGESISRKEHDRAVAMAEAAKAQLEQYNSALDTILDSTRDADARLRLYRPYFFYLSEMLRQRFDIFDRSLAMWSGATDSRGFFAARIATDPSLARLALDSEIHLFDWLNRDREATKTDPFMLYLHWQQLVTLAVSYCADHGCKPGDNNLGQIGTTDRMRVFERLATPGTREQFARWKQGTMSDPFVFRITLDPSKRLFSGQYLNVRNLDWNIVPVKRSGTLAGTHVEVRHMGHAQIPYEDRADGIAVVRLRDESMLSNAFSPSNRRQRFDATTLATRFQQQMDIATLQPLRGLEGWGLYGAYELTITPNTALRDVEDFEVEIAYIYTNPQNVTSELSFLAANPPPTTGCWQGKDAALADSACRTIYYFARNDCSTPPSAYSHRWMEPNAGLEYLYATRWEAAGPAIKLCQASATVPLARRAMEHQRASQACNWVTALADVRKLNQDGAQAVLTCKELSQ